MSIYNSTTIFYSSHNRYNKYLNLISDWEHSIDSDFSSFPPEVAKTLKDLCANLRENIYAFQSLPTKKEALNFVEERKQMKVFEILAEFKISAEKEWQELRTLQTEREQLALHLSK